MKLTGNTILITGGSNGIGLAMAKRFLDRENEVIVCGRREEKLKEVREKFPKIKTRVCDVGSRAEREALFRWATGTYPNLNVLVNNAGIQRRVKLTENENWESTRSEIAVNLEAPIQLCGLFYPHLIQKESSAILNVTSGLSFIPLANVPIYCATKAALHSYTLSLRWQLADTPVEVIEVIPPAVDTDLGGPGLHTFGVNVDEFADAVFEGLEEGQTEIAYGSALTASQASRDELDKIYEGMNSVRR